MEPEKEEIFHAQILYREWGRRFTFLQQYLKGIHYYEKSGEFGDKNFLWTLLGLSVALKQSGQFRQAAEVAQKCMNIDPGHLGANQTRMEALFDIAEFCYSLVFAHQGARQRTLFQTAVYLANQTIEDCVGQNVPSTMLRQLYPWISKMSAYNTTELERLTKEEDEFEGIGEEQIRFKVNDPDAKLQRHRIRHDRMMAGIYMGLTARDKYFLQRMLHHPGLSSSNKETNVKLATTITDCLNRLQSQQEALRTRRPLYAVHAYINTIIAKRNSLALYYELEFKRCLIRNEAKYVLRQLHNTRLARDYTNFFKMVERAQEKFESYGLRVFPERGRYLDGLYRMVARVYLDPRNLSTFTKDEANQSSDLLHRLLGGRYPRVPRDTDLAWLPTLDVKRAFRTCRERLALATRPLEILWLFHELSKLFLEVRRYDLSRFYAKKTRDLSLESGHHDWAINASHIIVRIELAQHNRNEAREAAIGALESAKKLGVAFLIDFYKRVLVYIDTIKLGRLGDEDSIATRRRLISGLMPPDIKPSMDLLLRAMEAVPAKRRLSVMPGCKPKDRKGKFPIKRMTIKPPIPVDYQKESLQQIIKKFAPSNRILGLVNFDDYD